MAHYLNNLFSPESIAVIGASDKPNSVGMRVFKNLLQNKFAGKLYAVNPKHHEVQKQSCFASVKDIPAKVDLAVITTPAATVPDLMRECGEKKVGAVIVISAGFSEMGSAGKKLEQDVLAIARRYKIQMIGPNCLGVMRPVINMNATFDNNFALPGSLALVSQSGALCAGILDWALEKKIGFSLIASLGNSVDVGFGDMLDYLALDPHTKSILLYIEGIPNARSFMSGLRAAARIKPVIVIKAGKHPQGSRAALSHTGALIGDDDVFAAALCRAGAVRVMSIEELFLAAEVLSSNYRVKGNGLMVITNGGGAGVMAADRAAELNVTLPALDEQSITELNKVLPAQWSRQNPVDVIGDATPKRYRAALEICRKDQYVDGILVILVPIAMVQPLKVAKEIVQDAAQSDKPILTCWMGSKHVKSSWKLFAANNIPYFDTPEKAVAAFSYLADYQRNQALLMQVPNPLSPQPKPDVDAARLIIEKALAESRTTLTTIESKQVLKAFAIPVNETIEVLSIEEAKKSAEILGFPVAMKISSPDITHKQDVGGVVLNIADIETVATTFNYLINNAKQAAPQAKHLGVTIERMFKSPNDRELMIGVLRDKVFGPVIAFGAGGSLVEIMHDRALALPPLNQFIATQLIAKTRIAKTLGDFRHMPAVHLDMIMNTLLRVSEMVCELPQIMEMDINPFIINEKTAAAVDARIVVSAAVTGVMPYQHMAIHPYPNDLITTHQLSDGTSITIRPIRPEDAMIEQEFVRNLSDESKYLRFMDHYQELTQSMLVRLTQIDYDREMALIAIVMQNNKEINIGVARYIINADGETSEIAIVVADSWQKKGIGSALLSALIEVAKARGIKKMTGAVLTRNKGMLELAQSLGFAIENSEDADIKMVIKDL